MKREPPQSIADYGPLFFPAGMLLLFFVVPFGTMIAVSFFQRQEGGFYTPAFVLSNYERFLSAFFGGVLGFSLMLAITVAICCVVLALPFTYLLTKLSRRLQVFWLVALLSVLSLSEVIIGFAWSTLLSRTAGLSNLLVKIGVLVTIVVSPVMTTSLRSTRTSWFTGSAWLTKKVPLMRLSGCASTYAWNSLTAVADARSGVPNWCRVVAS